MTRISLAPWRRPLHPRAASYSFLFMSFFPHASHYLFSLPRRHGSTNSRTGSPALGWWARFSGFLGQPSTQLPHSAEMFRDSSPSSQEFSFFPSPFFHFSPSAIETRQANRQARVGPYDYSYYGENLFISYCNQWCGRIIFTFLPAPLLSADGFCFAPFRFVWGFAFYERGCLAAAAASGVTVRKVQVQGPGIAHLTAHKLPPHLELGSWKLKY